MSTPINPKIEESWKRELDEEFHKDYFRDLKQIPAGRKGARGSVVFTRRVR